MLNRSKNLLGWCQNHALAATAMAFFASFSQVHAATAMLRVACDGPTSNAEVTINGKFKGDCPVDVSVVEGNLRIRVTKKVDSERELVFAQELRMVAGTVKRIDVEFGSPQLNAEGLRRLRLRQEARQAEIAAHFERQRIAAENGDDRAMVELAEAYENGNDKISRDPAQALFWYAKAAKAGNVEAMYRMIENDPTQAKAWLRKAAVAGHSSAKAQLDRLPRFCYARAVKDGIFSGEMVVSPGFEDIHADGTNEPIKAALTRYVAQLPRLQPGVWEEAVNNKQMNCETRDDEIVGRAMACYLKTPHGFAIGLRCGPSGEAEFRKRVGLMKWGPFTLLTDWRGE